MPNEASRLVLEDFGCLCPDRRFHGGVHGQNRLLYDTVTVLETEKRAWESSPEAEAMREVLNPWRHLEDKSKKNS